MGIPPCGFVPADQMPRTWLVPCVSRAFLIQMGIPPCGFVPADQSSVGLSWSRWEYHHVASSLQIKCLEPGLYHVSVGHSWSRWEYHHVASSLQIRAQSGSLGTDGNTTMWLCPCRSNAPNLACAMCQLGILDPDGNTTVWLRPCRSDA